ncbi:MAG: protein of unknown function DUF945 [Idiomarinaceae bacterium HL-53]|nr:MAG: protein of unknown function DUF945 [Idiomarinaceae bacterium HL-53]CUS47778.1 Bacterial protein of unknown function (DUF945) [Idiomarinaceae bacterium HL-53]
MKKILLTAVVLILAWFITIWQTGRVAVNTVEEQVEYLRVSAAGAFGTELEWTDKGLFGAEGVILIRGLEEDFSATQSFTLSHGFLKSDFVGNLDFDIEGLSATRLYGAEGIRTEGSFGLGGFSLTMSLDDLEFTDTDMTVMHSPLVLNAAGNDTLQQFEMSLESFQLLGPKSQITFAMSDLVANAATEYDEDKRMIRQQATYRVGSVSAGSSVFSLNDAFALNVEWHKAGEGIELSYDVEFSELVVNGVSASAFVEMNYRGGNYGPLYDHIELFLEELEQNPDVDPETFSQELVTNLLTPNMEFDLVVRDGDFGAFGEAEFELTFTAPDRAITNLEDNAELQRWLIDSEISGSIVELPAMVMQQLSMQTGLDPSTLPWDVSYSRDEGLVIGGAVVLPPEAIPTP